MINSLSEVEIALANIAQLKSELYTPVPLNTDINKAKKYKLDLKHLIESIEAEIKEYLDRTTPCKEKS